MSAGTNPSMRGNSWQYTYYTYDPVTQERKQHKKGGFATREEAKRHMDITLGEIAKGTYTYDKNYTLQQFLTGWYAIHSKTVEPSTAAGYKVNIYNHIIPLIGHTRLSDLNTMQLTAFYTRLSEQNGLSAATVDYVHRTLRKALNDALDMGLIQKNPCNRAKRPKKHKYRAKILNADQMRALISGCVGTEYETAILLAIALGLRRGEALAVRFGDFDFDAGTVHIQQQLTMIKATEGGSHRYGIKDVKTEDSNRILNVPQSILESVKERHRDVAKQKLLLGSKYQDNDLVTCNPDGTPVKPDLMYQRFKALLRKLNLPAVRFHDLRHSYATALIDMDIPLKAISKTLGHSTISITADIYCDSLEKSRAAADVIQRELFDRSIR